MKRYLLFPIFILVCLNLYGQSKIDKALKRWNKESVPYIEVEELKNNTSAVLLDARKREEFEVSHFKDAIWVGHNDFQMDQVTEKIANKDQEIVVYCSIGVRSENIGEKLMKAGYTNVRNLYGGIFQWKNNGLPVFDKNGMETQKVHAFNKQWGKLLKKGEKVYNAATVSN
ncbi:rhodanese-like domain-containing protein [Euzebyella saccharophila]|uniref:Rhodanese-like domain-containing protein n=1 Tax=Euzebyella saccharophila TaxID=679664 RepID=A0ABV8JLZ5_9FLAO|nr:rhodanese-like domain-containing protein [Euzebyella saccharophila]